MENHWWRNDRVYTQSNPCSRAIPRDTLLIWIPDELFNGAISLMHRDSSSIKTRWNDTLEESSVISTSLSPLPPSFDSFNCAVSSISEISKLLPGSLDDYYYYHVSNAFPSKILCAPARANYSPSIILSLSLTISILSSCRPFNEDNLRATILKFLNLH